jgi:predicted DNA-binding antitoxin AbrB/MazE fold protein
MGRRIQAVYKDGVLLPEEPLQLRDMQRVTVTITEPSPLDNDPAAYFTAEEWAEAARDLITWKDARQALAEISGSLSDAVTAQRQER